MASKALRSTKRAAKRRLKSGARKTGAWAGRKRRARREDCRARTDAAILRRTHAGCTTCGGTGTITKRKKDGSYAGSKSCPEKPVTRSVPRLKVAVEARVGQDKRSGLCGWSCPCGKKARPQWRNARAATTDLRLHEKKRHAGSSIGGAWFLMVPATAALPPTKQPAAVAA
ncbi:hypothetical protein [Streptomyces sp. NPDC054784]